MIVLAAVAVAGGLGAIARAAVGGAVAARAPDPAWGVAVVNVVGAAALAALAASDLGATALDVVGGGFLGGFTTFSTWMSDALDRESGPARLRATRVAAVVGGQVAAGLALAAVLLG